MDFVTDIIDISGSIYFINSDHELFVYEQKVVKTGFAPMESGVYKIKLDRSGEVIQRDFISYNAFVSDIKTYQKSIDWFIGLYLSDYERFLETNENCPFNVRPFFTQKRNLKKYQFQLISRASA